MAWRQRSIRYALAGLSAVAITGVSLAVGGARPADAADGSPQYYLALGDSLSQSVQPNASPPLFETNHGYVDDLYAAERTQQAGLQLQTLGCPGETTTTMISGGVCRSRLLLQVCGATLQCVIACAVSCSTYGIAGVPIRVEADIANGLPNFTVVGLTDRAIQESRERVRSAIRNSEFPFPAQRVTVNLAPAEVPKEGTGFDLAIALAVLIADGKVGPTHGAALIGELALDGTLRPVTGVLPMARCLAAHGVRRLIVGAENAEEAALVDGLEVLAAPTLRACAAHLSGGPPLDRCVASALLRVDQPSEVDLAEIRGQAAAKRALEIAAAGGHNVLMTGPPGAGKTMLARAFPWLLPDLPVEQALEVAAVYSLRGALRERAATSLRPPFRAPHHSVSRAGLVGGGSGVALPGEISLAHKGVLFLDELCEFPRTHLEALRQPLEERRVTVVRARAAVTYPSEFMLVAAANPCPCGHLGDDEPCRCSPPQLQAYQGRLSGPIKDRIDLTVAVPRQKYTELFGAVAEEPSAAVRARVDAARVRQRARQGVLNAVLNGADARAQCSLRAGSGRLLARAGERLRLSARAYFRVLRVARTIADLAADEGVGDEALAEAIRYRGAVDG